MVTIYSYNFEPMIILKIEKKFIQHNINLINDFKIIRNDINNNNIKIRQSW